MIADIASFSFMKCHLTNEINETIAGVENKGEFAIKSIVLQGREPALEFLEGMNVRIEKVAGYLYPLFSQCCEWINGAGTATDM
jgi:hypothetical protein